MRIYRSQNVLDASLDRIRWLYDEFDDVIVSMSGGKDSTVIFHLAQMVAEEKGRLPVPVMWLDQECEFAGTVDYMRTIMYREDVLPRWFQIPFRLFNATSKDDSWLNVWGPGEEWVRDKDPIAVTENTYGTDRFRGLLDAITAQDYAGKRAVALTGMRAEESRTRFASITSKPTYKWATWGAKNKQARDGEFYSMHPIYDWGYLDVWKAIHDHGWPYNSHYDAMHRYGVPVKQMRVSNYHHETAVHALFYLQEIEPDTYERAVQRIGGLDTAGKMGKADFFVRDLPFMFRDWREYRNYLLAHLIEPDLQPRFLRKFAAMQAKFDEGFYVRVKTTEEQMYRAQVQSILTNDWEWTKLQAWILARNMPIAAIKGKGASSGPADSSPTGTARSGTKGDGGLSTASSGPK